MAVMSCDVMSRQGTFPPDYPQPGTEHNGSVKAGLILPDMGSFQWETYSKTHQPDRISLLLKGAETGYRHLQTRI